MNNFELFDIQLNLAKIKSGLSDGNAIASSACIENILNAVEELSVIVKKIDNDLNKTN